MTRGLLLRFLASLLVGFGVRGSYKLEEAIDWAERTPDFSDTFSLAASVGVSYTVRIWERLEPRDDDKRRGGGWGVGIMGC